MKEATNDDVVSAIYDLMAEVEQARREIVAALSSVEAAVWDTMPT